MRRLLVIALMLAAGAAAVVASASAGSQDPQNGTYTVELDNAFGIVEGADVKVAGVRAGHITGMRVDRRTQARAGRLRDHPDRLRLAAHRRLLRDPPAVADRRVLRRLPARHAPSSG